MNGIDDIEFKIALLDLRPGDILVVKVATVISAQTHERMQEVIKRLNPNLKELILERGTDLAVLTAAEIESRTIAVAPSDAENAA